MEETRELDIVIPVYNEGANILSVLESFARSVKSRFRVLICFDHDSDDTLAAIASVPSWPFPIVRVKNQGKGAHGAVLSGFAASTAPYVLVFPADDDYNAPRIDRLVDRARAGADIVVASRFIGDGCMIDCPLLKNVLIRSSALALNRLAHLPTHDPSNGLRLFSRRVLRAIPIESTRGFTYSIELLVKAHRLGLKIEEVPFQWYQRKAGTSRFRVLSWAPDYLRWFRYAFATTWLRKGSESVVLQPESELAAQLQSS